MAARERNMTEQQKNQKIIEEVRRDMNTQKTDTGIFKEIFDTELKKSKCPIHQRNILGNAISGEWKVPLKNPRCRHCKQIAE